MNMHKLKQSKKRPYALDPVIAAAIDKTVEAAVLSKLESIDRHIAQTIRNCFDRHQVVDLSELKVPHKTYCPEAGP